MVGGGSKSKLTHYSKIILTCFNETKAVANIILCCPIRVGLFVVFFADNRTLGVYPLTISAPNACRRLSMYW